MDNILIFKALSSRTRIKILKILSTKELHISGLARKLGISVPVTLKHISILEKTGFIKRRIVGNIHLLSVKIENIERLFKPFIEKSNIEINQNTNLFDALKQIPGIEIKRINDKQFITSINGEEGFFIYEVDGIAPKISIDEYKPKKQVILQLKKLVPIDKKTIAIKIKK